jgi:predicted secreted protein
MKVLSALHDSIPVRFGHLQEKIMRVGRTIYVADLRSFSSTVDNLDMWVLKIDDQGRKQWDRTYGGSKWDVATSVTPAQGGGYMVAGITQSKGAGDTDMWVLKIDDQGRNQWDQTYGGSNRDAGNAIAPAPSGYIVAGSTDSKNAGNLDMWVVKLDERGQLE